MIDTHCHLDNEVFHEDLAEVLDRAFASGITHLIMPSISEEDRERFLQVLATDSRIFYASGIHPHSASKVTSSTMFNVAQFATDRRCVAIGEIGLDYYYDFSPRNTQIAVFTGQLNIAKDLNLPVIVHNRESTEDLMHILSVEQDGNLRGVLHCFGESEEAMKKAIDLDFMVSFTGNITFRNSTLDNVIRNVPPDRYMIETDAPYMTPVPYRGKRNEPSYMGLIAAKISEVRGTTIQQVIAETTANALRLFALPVMMLLVAVTMSAQPTRPHPDDFDHDYDYERAYFAYVVDSTGYEKYVKPKFVGLGITVGTNTIVEDQRFRQLFRSSGDTSIKPHVWETFAPGEGQRRSFSYEGIFAIGTAVQLHIPGFSDYLFFETAITYSKNDKPEKEFNLEPITYVIGEAALHANLNPYSRINFLFSAGPTFAIYNDGIVSSSKLGINTAGGIGVNLPTAIGLIYPMFLVRFNFMLGTDLDRVIARHTDEAGHSWFNKIDGRESVDRADVTTLYSMVRFSIVWFPRF